MGTAPHAGRIILGADQAARARGYTLMLVNTPGQPGPERSQEHGQPGTDPIQAGVESLLGRQVDGILYAPNQPSALICCNDRLAMGVCLAAAELGLSIPGHLSVVGFGDEELIAASLHPGLTSVALPHYEMGAWAANRLNDGIERGPADADAVQPAGSPDPVLIECRRVTRGSVAAPSTPCNSADVRVRQRGAPATPTGNFCFSLCVIYCGRCIARS